MRTGKVLAEQNSHVSMTPASCLKIVTTAAALHLLGADFRFETNLEYDQGNLIIRGGGDPCLGTDWKKQIETWADAVQKFGIQKVQGQVIGDASRWEKALAVPSWNWEDLGNHYGAGACALSFHKNSYFLFFKPGHQVGEEATILRTDPPMHLAFQNEVKTGPIGSGDCACIYGSEFSPLQFIRGSVPAGVAEFAIRGAIPDPANYCAELLSLELQKRGIAIEEQEITPQDRTILHTTYSPTVAEIVHQTNQKSVNLYAEHLLKKMGEVVYNEGSTEAGIKAVTQFWKSQGIEGFYMFDGSGLSRKNSITTVQLVQILLKMKDSLPFFESLPELQASVRAKSGSMSLVKGYAGFADNVAFAIIVNQCPNRKLIKEKIEDFFSLLKG